MYVIGTMAFSATMIAATSVTKANSIQQQTTQTTQTIKENNITTHDVLNVKQKYNLFCGMKPVEADSVNDVSIINANTVILENNQITENSDENAIENTSDEENETDIDTESETYIDPDELYMLSHLIYAEVGSELCSDTERYYAGSVVLNRIKSHWFKETTMHDVIFANGQYACTWLGTYYNQPTQNCIDIAYDLLANGSVLPENVVFQAEFKQGDGVYAHIGKTYFCYLND